MAKRIGEIFHSRGYVTREQVRQALETQSKSISYQLLGQILLDQGTISSTQAQLFHYCQKCTLLDLIASINSSLDLQSLLRAIMEAAQLIMEAEASSLILRDKKTGELIITVPTGPARSEISGIRIPPDQGFCGWVATYGEPLIVADAQKDPRFFGDVDPGFRTVSLICVPLHNPHGEIMGVLQAINKRGGGVFTEADLPLFAALAHQAAIALEKARLQKESVEKQLLERELAVATQIQQGFWPKQVPAYPDIEMAALSVPATHIGGDYYDFVSIPEGHCGLVIGDVSGKGVPAALLMATLRAVLRSQVENRHTVEETVFLVNNTLVKDTPLEKFATLFFAVLNVDRQELSYVNAGHNPPIIYDPITDEIKLLSAGGPVIGVLPEVCYESAREKLNPGQVLVMYTDGATEAQNPEEEMFGEQRLQSLIRLYAHEDPNTILTCTHQAIVNFTRGAPQSDDLTLVVMKVKDTRT